MSGIIVVVSSGKITSWRDRNVKNRRFFKIIQSYADCKLVIDNYKTGVVCIYSLASMESSEAREKMNYISGGVYALDGDISTVGENVFMARPALQVCSR